MTEEMIEGLLPRLERKLGLKDTDEEIQLLLVDELLDAEGEILMYLGRSTLEERLLGSVVALAGVFYRRDCAEHPELRSMSYTEGQLSESKTFLTAQEYRNARAEVLESLRRYRRVACR